MKEKTLCIANIAKDPIFDIKDFRFVKNAHNKPRNGTGMWVAPMLTPKVSTWMEWSTFELGFEDATWYVRNIELNHDFNMYVIDSLDDLNILGARGLIDAQGTVNFELLSLEYDGIYLTHKGQMDTRICYPYNLYGWDMESMLILNPKFSFGELSVYKLTNEDLEEASDALYSI